MCIGVLYFTLTYINRFIADGAVAVTCYQHAFHKQITLSLVDELFSHNPVCYYV